MKKSGILNAELLHIVSAMGHGDMLFIVDRGFPFPAHNLTKKIDLAVGLNIPRFLQVLEVVLEDLEIEKAIIAQETETVSPEVYKNMLKILEGVKNKGRKITIDTIPHTQFKHLGLRGAEEGEEVKAIVRTGEFTPYSNIILISGVPF
jgi:D-ribose pyranase